MPQYNYLDDVAAKTPRLTADNLVTENSVLLCEEILKGINHDVSTVIKSPAKSNVESMIKLFSSKYFNAITMGHGDVVKNDFLRRLDGIVISDT